MCEVNIYKENNQLHKIDGPAFDVINSTVKNKSAYFYKNKQIDMSKITIFNEDDTIVIYGINYLTAIGILSDETFVLNIDYKEKKINYCKIINFIKQQLTRGVKENIHNLCKRFNLRIDTNNKFYENEHYMNKIMSLEKYILGLTLQQICDQNRWSTCNLMLMINVNSEEPPNDIEESQDDIEESHDDIEESHDDIEESHDDIEESQDDIEESHDDIEESHDDIEESHSNLLVLVKQQPVKKTDNLIKKNDAFNNSNHGKHNRGSKAFWSSIKGGSRKN